MGQQHIYLAAWGNGHDYVSTRGCHHTEYGSVYDDWYKDCKGDSNPKSGGDFVVGQGKKPCPGCRTPFYCVKACGDKVRHTKTRAGHPCKGATSIKGIPINISNSTDVAGLRDQFSDAPGAFDCTFDIDAQVLKEWSDDPTRDKSRGCGKSAYDQALFGVDGTCESDTTDDAFCAQAENLAKIVDKWGIGGGKTCFDKLQEKGKQATAAQQGRTFCETKPEDEKCTCINLAKNYNGGGYIEYCKAHPEHAGCEEINRELMKYKLVGITKSLHSTIGPATCLMPNACTDDQYLPINGKIETCRNQVAICDQLMNFPEGTSVFAMRDIITKQNCSINFESDIKNVCKANEDGICTQGASPIRDTSARLGDGQVSASDINPGSPGGDGAIVFDDDAKKATALGVGGVSIASAFLCVFASMALFAAS